MNYCFLGFMLLAGYANAQKNPGPQLVAMGSGGAALRGIWCLQQNPAGIAGTGKSEFAVSYEQHLLDQQLSTQTALLVIASRRSALGIGFERYGLSEYAEQNAALSYARSFGESFRMAIGLRYYQLSISRYGSAHSYSVELGFQVDVAEGFSIGAHVSNPSRNRYENVSGSSLPVRLALGCSYAFSDKVIVIADIRKQLDYPMDVMSGLEYKLDKGFALRGGVSANPFKQYTGFGLDYRKFNIDFALASHPHLGYSPQVALGYEF